MKKTMIIGLGPEYNYPRNAALWNKENTRYASNHGASLISRALMKQLKGDYIDDFKNPVELEKKYSNCVIAFATHVTEGRDVTEYVEFIEKIKMPVHIFSLGIQDYVGENKRDFKIHPSMTRLLEIVSERSNLIGVRGNYTASVLYKNGFKNIRPIGCPTLFYGLKPNLEIKKPEKFSKPLFVFHRTLLAKGYPLIKDITWLGQDFLDEAIFNNNPFNDADLYSYEMGKYNEFTFKEDILNHIKENAVFPPDFETWFEYISNSDFVFGPRLHGCIAAIIQGIPAVMVARDLRVQEMAEMFSIPFITYKELENNTVESLFDKADYSEFNKLYPERFKNYVSLLNTNNISHNLETSQKELFQYQGVDLDMIQRITYTDYMKLKEATGNAVSMSSTFNNAKRKYPFITKFLRRLVH